MNIKSSNSAYDYDMLVIGCGPGGQKAAIQAAKLRKRVAVIDSMDLVGGNCVNTSTIPSKSFKEAIAFLSGYRQRSIYGAGYRVKTKIEMSDLTYRCSRLIQTEVEVIRDQLLRNHIEIMQGYATFKDAHTLTIRESTGRLVDHTAEFIVIATGARPFRPANIAFDGENIFDSDDILTLKEIPRTITVVGGGVIGTEYASMFAALGVNVTIIDGRDKLLGFLDREIIDCAHYQLRSMGVSLRLGENVEECYVREDGTVVTRLKSGKVVVSDCVLVSAGRTSSTQKIGLEEIGMVLGDKGKVEVNQYYQTSIPHIYAVGDVIGFPGLAATASGQGRLAAAHAYGIADDVLQIPLPFGIYSIPEISYVGQNEQELTEQNIPYETGIARFREIVRGQILGDEDGMLKVLFHRETKDILGVHIIGEFATELIHIGQAAMSLKGGLHYLRDAVFNYPTLAECYKVAAFDGYNKIRVAGGSIKRRSESIPM